MQYGLEVYRLPTRRPRAAAGLPTQMRLPGLAVVNNRAQGAGSARYPRRMLYLASKSPRRRELLTQLGVDFELIDASVDEYRRADESPSAYVSRVAREKAEAGLAALVDQPDALVLGADTEVVLGGDVFGKPADGAEAAAMLRRLSGTAHEVISTVWLLSSRRRDSAQCVTRVRFGQLSAPQIDRYIATGEWHDKAGGYAVQGRGGALIAHLSGSYSGVMGLPLFETRSLLAGFGVEV